MTENHNSRVNDPATHCGHGWALDVPCERCGDDPLPERAVVELRAAKAELESLRKYRDDIMRDIKYGAQKMGDALGMAPNDYTPTHEVAARHRGALIGMRMCRKCRTCEEHMPALIAAAGSLPPPWRSDR